jgi:hypothetical protein
MSLVLAYLADNYSLCFHTSLQHFDLTSCSLQRLRIRLMPIWQATLAPQRVARPSLIHDELPKGIMHSLKKLCIVSPGIDFLKT